MSPQEYEATSNPPRNWRTQDVWSISLSAFFADLGYQSVLAAFPLFLVIELHRPAWEYGLAMALSYGGGAIFSMIGARIGDRIGHRKMAIFGNCLIPLLSLSALMSNPAWTIGLLCGGWWARNLRSPSRRVMLNEAVPADEFRVRIFGFLHALDVGGAAAAALLVLIALDQGVPFKLLFLFTAIPLGVSTLMLSRASTGRVPLTSAANSGSDYEKPTQRHLSSAKAIFLSTALFGFTFYSIGFPVLTVAQKTGSDTFGVIGFLVFQGFSAATGYLLAQKLGATMLHRFVNLGMFGYFGSALGAIVMIADVHYQLGTSEFLLGLAILGFALGVVETLEPSLVAVLSKGIGSGRGFGALASSRSVGLFAGNIIMGLLYQIGPSWSYGYAAAMAIAAAAIMLFTAKRANAELTDLRGQPL